MQKSAYSKNNLSLLSTDQYFKNWYYNTSLMWIVGMILRTKNKTILSSL